MIYQKKILHYHFGSRLRLVHIGLILMIVIQIESASPTDDLTV